MKAYRALSKKTVALLSACVLLFGIMAVNLPVTAKAEEVLTFSYVNPLYDDVAQQRPLLYAAETGSSTLEKATLESAGAVLREGMEAREQTIAVTYTVNGTDYSSEQLQNQAKDILNEATKHTGVPTQGDYILWHYAGYNGNISLQIENEKTHITLTYQMRYYTTAEQEQEVDAAIDALLDRLDVATASDYEKVCAVYDYICGNITYDTAGLSAGNTIVYTTYSALMRKQAVCQGYATLFYRLALELGVDARLIAGTAEGGRHGWNIVKLSGKYYNLDTTWDAGRVRYAYFLKAEENFSDHTRFDEYNTLAFHTQYPMDTSDYDPFKHVQRGTTGDCTWTLDNTVLTISGNGAMGEYDYWGRAPWGQDITAVIIENGVTAIGATAFYDCDALSYVSIPKSVTSIGIQAFAECDALNSAEISDKVTDIGHRAFGGCTSLESITVDDNNAYYCDQDGVLFNKAKNALLQYPAGKSDIAYTTPNGVENIGSWAFTDCSKLQMLTVGDSVKTIGIDTFLYCDALKTAIIGDGVTEIGEYAFYECPSLEKVVIGESVTTIGTKAFYGCDALSSVTFGNSVKIIDEQAFYDCTALKSVVIPDSVVTIGGYAFRGCSALNSISLGKNVSSIGSHAFWACNALKDVWCANTDRSNITIDNEFNGNNPLFYAVWHYKYIEPQNRWMQLDGKWYYFEKGVMVKNAWRKDSKGWVKLGQNGAMLINQWTTDSKGWCYVGADGYAVTNCWKKDSTGWIYLDANGSMTKAKWVIDGSKWYYCDANGYMVANKWMKDSKGWVYLGSNGAMKTNAWVRDSVGWCYVGGNGYAVTNCWKKDSVGWCYLNSNGSMTKSKWVQDNGKWYYCDGNGYMVSNKALVIGSKKYNFNAAGVCTNP